MANRKVRVRAAPSPTGRVHTGNLRTFLNNYLYAKSVGGKFVLRIEDTDIKRKVEGGIEAIIEVLKLYGIEFDEGPVLGGKYGPYIQSERLEIYAKYAKQLVDQGDAYYCFCSEDRLSNLRESQRKLGKKPGYDGHCRSLNRNEAKRRVARGEKHVIRMKFPREGWSKFRCEINGKISIKNCEFVDEIILKSDGYPVYNFAVVIDDHLMKITHVFRGREYLTQTPKNIFLYNAFGWIVPKFIHTPHLLNPDGKGKLSKRNGAVPAISYLRKGYLPEAVLNYLALCGWAPPENKKNNDDVYSIDELISLFTLDRMKKSNARYDQKKLDYLNGKHIRKLGVNMLSDRVIDWAENLVLKEFIADKFDEHFDWEKKLRKQVEKYLPMWKSDKEYFKQALATEYERLTCLSELPGRLDFFYDEKLTWTDEDWRTKNHSKKELAIGLGKVLPRLEVAFEGGKVFDHDKWNEVVRNCADEMDWKHGDLFMAIRSATTGRLQSPPLLECFKIMGWERVKGFIEDAIVWLSE